MGQAFLVAGPAPPSGGRAELWPACVARMATQLAGLPVGAPGVTLNRLCGSGPDALAQAARSIRGGCRPPGRRRCGEHDSRAVRHIEGGYRLGAREGAARQDDWGMESISNRDCISGLMNRQRGMNDAAAALLGLPDNAEHVNPNGGAIALGHPLGASGARLALTAAIEMSIRQARRAVATMYIGVGQGIPVLLEAA
jgi:acetyl-CoA acetyltransferase